MRFLSLKVTNFLTLGDVPTLTLDERGLVLLRGVNDDDSSARSNGAGKSSLADALLWALYGVTARGESGDAVVNQAAKKNCFVEVTLQDGETVYRVARHRKHSLYKNQTMVQVWTKQDFDEHKSGKDISKGTEKETQEVIEKLLGSSYEVFMASVYAAQDNMPNLPAMSDKQLKTIVEEAAGIDRIEAAYEIAKQRVNAAKLAFGTIETRLNNQRSNLATDEVALANAEQLVRNHEVVSAKRVLELRENAKATLQKVMPLSQQLAGLNTDQANTERQQAVEKMLTIKAANDEVSRLYKRRADTGAAITSSKQQLEQAKQELLQAKDRVDNPDKHITKPCPTCGTVRATQSKESFVEHAKKHLQEIATKYKSIEARIGILNADYQAAVAEHEAFSKTVPDSTALSQKIRDCDQVLLKGTHLLQEIEAIKVEAKRLLEQAKQEETAPNPHASLVEAIRKRLAQTAKQIEELKAASAQAEEDLAVAESVATVFGPSGVRAHILDTVTPYLNERTSEYLSELSDGNITAVWSTLAETAKGDLREKFNIEVENVRGGKSYGLLSGGEKRKVRVSTMLALQDLVASRATKPIALWIGDEIDDALDSAGLERMMGILERKAREKGTVLVISHNDLRDWIDNVVTVTKRNGQSTVDGVLVA